MKKKVLHILEISQFLKLTVNCFEKINPGGNTFLAYDEMVLHKGINVSEIPQVESHHFNSDEYKNFLKDAESKYYLIIFHNIGLGYKREIISMIDGVVPIHGILWGYEIYDNPRLHGRIYQKKTRAYLKSINKAKRASIGKRFKEVINGYLKPNSYWNKTWEVFEHLSSYSTILESERSFIERFYEVRKPCFPFNYSGGYQVSSAMKERRGKDILIGNSATLANNHLDVIEILSELKEVQDSKIVLSLSYGDNIYAEHVEQAFRKAFGDRVTSLREFMPIDEYNKVVSSCGYVIMNHIRQQAMGSIYLAILQGAKVFLNKKGFAYQDLISAGIRVYALEELKKEYPHSEDFATIDANRKIIEEIRGEAAILENARRILKHYNFDFSDD